jgi:hypothetical protein
MLADWVAAHHATLTAVTGWTITPADVTDDRLGRLLEVFGEDTSQITVVQQALGRHIVRVYALPTTVARMDTTSLNVTHGRLRVARPSTPCSNSATAKTTAPICSSSSKPWRRWTRAGCRS